MNNIIDQLLRDEGGYHLKPYTDTVGKLTIGCGRNLTDNGISKEEAGNFLWNDLRDVSIELVDALPWVQGLDPVRFGALKNMAFNMGVQGLLGFRKFLGFMQAGSYDDAGTEMLDSKWADQVGSRAQRLSIQVRTGVWQ